ncbi:hypothetical protein [Streptomyces sp. NBC_00385]|uniref:hypothetical protein n=1 Tax=Streptomyces sp. NBC_00385 TaxID=2975733 RepID=UPI002DD7C439|nr:hypothetical protein [Streptomyces sp. NBC_00385]WRZ08672.1 hypothetical protein OG959_37650 [Streptomyces sp. NBC_00385]
MEHEPAAGGGVEALVQRGEAGLPLAELVGHGDQVLQEQKQEQKVVCGARRESSVELSVLSPGFSVGGGG